MGKNALCKKCVEDCYQSDKVTVSVCKKFKRKEKKVKTEKKE